MNAGFFIVLLVVGVFVQSVISTIPLTLGFFIVAYILYRKSWVFWLAFCAGIIIDVLTINQIGLSSIFFVGVLILVSLYERKFEIKTREFVGLSTLFSSILYLLLIGGNVVIVQGIVAALLSLTVFAVSQHIDKKRREGD